MANPSKGYPSPGPQEIPVKDIMDGLYFMTDEEWSEVRETGDFDYVVIGSSFCALGFTHQMLQNKPDAKILIIDRGAYFHPEHFQNLPPAYSLTVGGLSETFHWKITEETHNGKYIKYQHGMNNFFGGRSCFWSAWCPEPTDEEMADWPQEVISKVHKYFPKAAELLNVVPANKISSSDNAIFGKLQDTIYKAVKDTPSKMEAITRVLPAPLAVKADSYRNTDYEKFSVSGPLLDLVIRKNYEAIKKGSPPQVRIMLQCLVRKIQQENGKAIFLETNKKIFKIGKAKLILAMGTLPPTTLMLNSFPSKDFEHLSSIGTRFSSHFISAVIARIPKHTVVEGELAMGAIYIAGENPKSKMQFHIQLTAVIDATPVENIYDTIRYLPDVVASPSIEQLLTSKDHIVYVCASLGQIDHNNPNNHYKLNNDENIECNATLQVVTNKNDEALWDTMDNSTFQVLEDYLSDKQIEYWNPDTSKWQKDQPSTAQIRVPGLVHESSTMWIGDTCSSPVDLDYKFRGVENVYLTGGALWPTGASWNPTCAMTTLAMDLADKLSK